MFRRPNNETILKKETATEVFSYEFWNFLKKTYFVKCLQTTASVYFQANTYLEKGLLACNSLLIHYNHARSVKTKERLLIHLQIKNKVYYGF